MQVMKQPGSTESVGARTRRVHSPLQTHNDLTSVTISSEPHLNFVWNSFFIVYTVEFGDEVFGVL